MRFYPFFWDSNHWFGTIDSVEKFHEMLSHVLRTESDLDHVLSAKMAPVLEIDELPKEYFMGSGGVTSGDLRSFGYRREHIPGTVRLEDWAKTRGMDLRKLSETQAKA